MKAKEFLSDFARGGALGTGILPGVSAGTVGIIVNVYDKLIAGIDGLRHRKTFWPSLLSILPIGLGSLVMTVLLMLFWSKVANPYFPFVIICALAGFVIGAMPILTSEISGRPLNGPDYLRIVLGFLFAAAIGICAYLSAAGVIPVNLDFNDEIQAPFQNPWIFALVLGVGFFAAFSCLIPGISGAMIMFIFSLYNPIVDLFFTKTVDGVVQESIFRDPGKLGGGLVILVCCGVGVLIGLLAVSNLMKGLLTKHRHATFTVIIGFVLGSLVSMFLNNDTYSVYHTPPLNAWWQFLIGGIALAAVAGGTFYLVRRSQKNAKKKQEEAAE